jgi:hypothetical protein
MCMKIIISESQSKEVLKRLRRIEELEIVLSTKLKYTILVMKVILRMVKNMPIFVLMKHYVFFITTIVVMTTIIMKMKITIMKMRMISQIEKK